jgi:transcription-repair coupling factor (superfamily II helicase)
LRLQALEECVDLGQGVNVAQRDLTIRGTGEVFGEKQSGKLSAEIGADLFNEMLFDSLYRAQTESLPRVSFDDVKVRPSLFTQSRSGVHF